MGYVKTLETGKNMANIELDNIKMWESILKRLNPYKEFRVRYSFECVLKDQGLQYNSNTEKIESIEPEPFKLEVGKLYKCTKDCYTAVGEKIISEGKLYHCTAENEVFSEFGYSIWVGDLLCYLRPATPEEIPQEPKQDPCIDCKMAAGGCALCCSKFKEYHSQNDQEELSEFENCMMDYYVTGTAPIEADDGKDLSKLTKEYSSKLLSIARKQIASEIKADTLVEEYVK